jgi:hypothetical protein
MVQRGNLVIIAVSGTIAGVVMLALLLALLLVGHARHRHHSPPAPSVITVAPSVFTAIPIPLYVPSGHPDVYDRQGQERP